MTISILGHTVIAERTGACGPHVQILAGPAIVGWNYSMIFNARLPLTARYYDCPTTIDCVMIFIQLVQ